MSSNPSLYQRRRPPNAQELESIPWLRLLQLHERDRAVSALQVTQVFAGEHGRSFQKSKAVVVMRSPRVRASAT